MNDQSDDEGRRTEPGPESGATPEGEAAASRTDDRPGRQPGDLAVALSPQQILGGFALLAALILLLKRRGQGKG